LRHLQRTGGKSGDGAGSGPPSEAISVSKGPDASPPEREGIDMITDNGKYQLSTEFVAGLVRTPLDGPSLRVLHACLHLQSYKLG
jgi:hypothetical protein